ncbi:MAG: LptF/LptG family permease [Halofilum sp. (in: g-proteobacteria)]|nr:LptF/LptG family permease [Halofilum sp. (in: g-proteobacteria)]
MSAHQHARRACSARSSRASSPERRRDAAVPHQRHRPRGHARACSGSTLGLLLLAFGRMYAESEMAALGACGVGMARLYRPVLIAAVIAAALTASLTIMACRPGPSAARSTPASPRAWRHAPSSPRHRAAVRFNRTADGRVVLFAEGRDDAGLGPPRGRLRPGGTRRRAGAA